LLLLRLHKRLGEGSIAAFM